MKTKEQILNTLSRQDITILMCIERMLRPHPVKLNERVRFTPKLDKYFYITSINKDYSVNLASADGNQSMSNVKISDLIF